MPQQRYSTMYLKDISFSCRKITKIFTIIEKKILHPHHVSKKFLTLQREILLYEWKNKNIIHRGAAGNAFAD
ncbi:MAG: hypothetical protein LBR06_05850, partial [Bacteroidales bacterium]|nr:hypothetical protein [Bacteroidales bacterium]